MRVSQTTQRCLLFAAALMLAGLASCDKMQEAVEQAKTEAAKIQAQAEQEAQKIKDEALQAAAGSAAESAPASGDAPAAAPAIAATPAQDAIPGEQLVKQFLALRPYERTDLHLIALAALDESSRGLLERVELQGSPITSAGIAVLPQFSRLKLLNCTLKEMTAADLAVVAKIGSLEELYLDSANVDDQELAELRPLVNLKTLTLTLNPITDAGLPALQNLAALEKLVLSQLRVSGNEIARLKCLSGLKHLEVSETNFGQGGEKALRQMDQLEVLIAVQCGMNDVLVAQLKGRTGLRQLDVGSSPQLTDRGGMQLSGCTNLTLLGIGSTSITDATLNSYRKMKQLKQLNIVRTKCSVPGVAALQKALPELKIDYP